MRVLLTGAGGRLGSELMRLLPMLATAEGDAVVVQGPSRTVLDVTDGPNFVSVAVSGRYDVILHAAAFTDVSAAEVRRDECWRINVGGTRHAATAAAAAGAKLVHISTDYVFWGESRESGGSGGYSEDDTPGPVRNYYALTKLVAEEAARAAPDHLIIRTSFRPRAWPYPEAYSDVFTSQDYVDVIAPDVALAAVRAATIGFDTMHIATERKSVLELARRRAPHVRAGSKVSAGVALPDDVSLDARRWRDLKRSWMLEGGA